MTEQGEKGRGQNGRAKGRKRRQREGPAECRVAEGNKTTEKNLGSDKVSRDPPGEGQLSLAQVSSSRYSLRQAGSGSCCTAWGRKRKPSERRTA